MDKSGSRQGQSLGVGKRAGGNVHLDGLGYAFVK